MRFKASIQVRRVVGVILLVCGLQLSGQQRALGAEAEAKAAIFTSFDPRAPTSKSFRSSPATSPPTEAIPSPETSCAAAQMHARVI
jgi:hypothetical protein